ncbi:hypothetical protein [Kitasatospora sp. MAP5-34]|uniref:hypothetical protein n=1 Tax=Kitasatospora sp. MAP5-34 TaxID=3035102 RepID=UPI0024752D75|nr:hypothetical protein [Kitasatospora sp. MAP5-34]MDH6574969.1 hypothetical protein [Kitasatospora sp. MAP5-34]
MTDQDNTAPAVWDPTARGGAGGWVRPQPAPEQRQQQSASPPGAIGDQGPPLGARPYLPTPPPQAHPTQAAHPTRPADASADYGYPLAPPAPPAGPPGFPAHSAGFPTPAAPAPSPAFPPTGFPPPAPGYGYPAPGFPPTSPPTAGYGYPPPGFPPGTEYRPYEELTPYEHEERPRSRTSLYVALAVGLVVVLGGGAVWTLESNNGSTEQAKPAPATSTPPAAPTQPDPAQSALPGTADASSSPSPSASASGAGPGAAAEAKALDDLLARGENAKAPIGNAVAKVDSCPGKAEVESAAQVFQDGATQRDQLIADLAKINLADLPGGTDAAQSLRTAWQQSGDIDRAYAAWAHTVGSQGCTGGAAPNTADLKRANDLNPQATQSKKDFVAKWTPLAATFNLTVRTWDRI